MNEVRDAKPSTDTLSPGKRGAELLHDPALNKGTAFTMEERARLGLEGLLPPRVSTLERQAQRLLENVRRRGTELEKYVEMLSLLDRNETLFYRVVMDNIVEMLPVIYTPGVGAGCQLYSHIFRRSRGLFITRHDKGRVAQVLRNWPRPDVRVIVVTDGERILGLGDLGASGMGIPVGKTSLYTACAGVAPSQTLPVTLDVGTNNEALLKDPLYLGLPERRLEGAAYDELVDEFVWAAQEVFPQAMIQFEDFANRNAFRLLAKYRGRVCCFNDDIQGTAAVTLAGLYSACRLLERRLPEQKILFCGAGEAAVGIANLVVAALEAEGLGRREAMERCWFVDSKGLVQGSRRDLAEFKRPYAHAHAPASSLLEALRALKPTALIGVSGQGGQFTKEVVEAMASLNERPIVFALSNPTSKSECTAEQACQWSGGKAVFASGSPFPPVSFQGRTLVPGQSNNAYVFPGIGLGVTAAGISRVDDELFLCAARELSACAGAEDLASGSLFPPMTRIREVSARIAAAVARNAAARGLTRERLPADLLEHMRAAQYRPVYKTYV